MTFKSIFVYESFEFYRPKKNALVSFENSSQISKAHNSLKDNEEKIRIFFR